MNDNLELDLFIKNESQQISDIFKNVSLNGYIKKLTFNIDSEKLNPKYSSEINITINGDFVEMFSQLQEFDDYPALYYFQINPLIEKEEIITLIKGANLTHNLKIPALNKNHTNSGILYVGKVTRCAWGRLIQHLGYHSYRNSHGLQIDHWANRTTSAIHLSFTIYFFDKSTKEYINILERKLAKFLKPIIGKH